MHTNVDSRSHVYASMNISYYERLYGLPDLCVGNVGLWYHSRGITEGYGRGVVSL